MATDIGLETFWSYMAKSRRGQQFGVLTNGTVMYRGNCRPAVLFKNFEVWFDTMSRGEMLAGHMTTRTFQAGKERT